MLKRSVSAVALLAVVALAAAGCAHPPPPPARELHAPMPYARRFPITKDRTFQATRTALATFGYTVTFADPERGTVKTAPKMHRLARLSSSAAGDFEPMSHAFVISVRDDGAGNSVVTGYLRTFSAEHETTKVVPVNAPIVQEMWSRLFAEIAADL